ncbi:MAG: hypothetical protein LBH55_00170, partial [Mycoplasmataceae bacterium]|nr:hypothetical protein [Mycoplasmataceae bacterium]
MSSKKQKLKINLILISSAALFTLVPLLALTSCSVATAKMQTIELDEMPKMPDENVVYKFEANNIEDPTLEEIAGVLNNSLLKYNVLHFLSASSPTVTINDFSLKIAGTPSLINDRDWHVIIEIKANDFSKLLKGKKNFPIVARPIYTKVPLTNEDFKDCWKLAP